MAQEQHNGEHRELVETVHKLAKHRSGIVLSGQIKDGKVELDQRTLDEIAKSFAGANRSFVAVNAPFDPNSQAV
jgi:hypothetical protein